MQLIQAELTRLQEILHKNAGSHFQCNCYLDTLIMYVTKISNNENIYIKDRLIAAQYGYEFSTNLTKFPLCLCPQNYPNYDNMDEQLIEEIYEKEFQLPQLIKILCFVERKDISKNRILRFNFLKENYLLRLSSAVRLSSSHMPTQGKIYVFKEVISFLLDISKRRRELITLLCIIRRNYNFFYKIKDMKKLLWETMIFNYPKDDTRDMIIKAFKEI